MLTERTDHLEAIAARLVACAAPVFALHGRLSRKERDVRLNSPEPARVLLATGRLVSEGFDPPPLDTLILVMTVFWKGTLQQYAGRLHREHVAKAGSRTRGNRPAL